MVYKGIYICIVNHAVYIFRKYEVLFGSPVWCGGWDLAVPCYSSAVQYNEYTFFFFLASSCTCCLVCLRLKRGGLFSAGLSVCLSVSRAYCTVVRLFPKAVPSSWSTCFFFFFSGCPVFYFPLHVYYCYPPLLFFVILATHLLFGGGAASFILLFCSRSFLFFSFCRVAFLGVHNIHAYIHTHTHIYKHRPSPDHGKESIP